MGLIASEKTGRTPAPIGTHVANCYGLIDLGTQMESFEGKPPKPKHKVWIWWELCHETDDDGSKKTVGTFFTVGLHEKSTLRKTLEAWRGRAFTAEELKGFDLGNIVGKPCMVTITHQPRKAGGVSDKVSGVSGLPKGMKAEPVSRASVTLDLDPEKFDRAVYDTLPNFLKDTIGKSPEGKALGLGQGASNGKEWPTNPPDGWDEQGRPIRGGVVVYEDGADPDVPF